MTTPVTVPAQGSLVIYTPADDPEAFPLPAVVIRSNEQNGLPGSDSFAMGVEDYVRELPEGHLTIGVFSPDGYSTRNNVPPSDWTAL